MQKYKNILLISLLAFFSIVKADTNKDQNTLPQPSDSAPMTFSGSVSVGGVLNTGNSNAYSLTTGANLNYSKKKWENTASFQSQIGGDRSKGLNSRNYNLQGETKYFFAPPTCYMYGLATYTLNSFNAYRTVLTVSSGYGKRLIARKTMTLDLQIGPSYTRRRVSGTNGPTQSRLGVFTSADYNWNISDDISFEQTLSFTKDKDNLLTQATSSLNSNIIDNMALKISFNYKHNTQIPSESSDTKKTDTTTNVSVVYKF